MYPLIGLIILALGWIYYLGVCLNQQYNKEIDILKNIVKQQAQLLIQHEKSLVAMNEEEQSSTHVLQQLEQSMQALETRYEQIQSIAGNGKDYHQLSELIKKGFDHEDMMKSFGLSRGEIQLMKSLNQSRG